MRITIASAGARSDLHFIFGLAKILHERNHVVTLVAPEKYRSQIMKMDVRMITCGPSFEEFLETDGTDRTNDFARTVAGQIASQFVSLRDALRESDVIVSGTLMLPAASMAEKQNLPHYQIIQSPLLLERSRFPLIGIANERISGLFGMKHKSLKKEWDENVADVLNHERKFSQLSPVGDIQKNLFESGHQIVCVDTEVASVHEAPNRTITGFMPPEFFGDPDEAAMEFLNSGQKPVYIAPVGLPSDVRPVFIKELSVALAATGLRIAFRDDWINAAGLDLPATCYSVDPANELQFLSRCSILVHDGSAGLTLAGARAGVPQVIAPFLVDQYFWAERIRANQLGIEVSGKLDTNKLIRAVQQAAVDDSLRQRAAAFAEKLRVKNGLAAAADLIEQSSAE